MAMRHAAQQVRRGSAAELRLNRYDKAGKKKAGSPGTVPTEARTPQSMRTAGRVKHRKLLLVLYAGKTLGISAFEDAWIHI